MRPHTSHACNTPRLQHHHPPQQGFQDEAYKQRRVMIANIARQHEM
jgi:hypothetical protein